MKKKPFPVPDPAVARPIFRAAMKKWEEEAARRKRKEPCTPPPPDPVEQLWLNEFVVDHSCGLCANTGMIGPLAKLTPGGKLVVLTRRPCICPNGRFIRREG